MKILRLKSRNINSLKGDNEIDFVNFLGGNSLFAITGETGSGKTTLLDVITCALYGRTARLSRGTEVHELMSRGTAEAMCEVEFEVNQKRYRSSWTIRRARGASDGKVQPTRMELVSLPDEAVLESKAREVPKRIEEITGLDFDRFTQSMMLAQGGFDAFLRAEEKERSKLLEKITGTKIYSEISKRVFEEERKSKREIETLEAELRGIGILPSDERRQLNELYERQKEEVAKNKILMEHAREAYELKVQHGIFLKELEENRKKEAEAKAEVEEKASLYDKLFWADKALAISAIHVQKKAAEKALNESRQTLHNLKESIQALSKKIEVLKEEKQKAQDAHEKEKLHFEAEIKKLKQAEELQNKAKSIDETIQAHKKTIKDKEHQTGVLKADLAKLIKKEEALKNKLKGYESYREKHAEDAKLVSDIESIAALIGSYYQDLSLNKESSESLKKTEAEKAKIQAVLSNADEKLQVLKKKSDEARQFFDKADSEVKSLEKEEAGLKETQKVYEEILRKLEAFRGDTKQLKEEKEKETQLSTEAQLLSTQRKELQEKIVSIEAHLRTLRDKKEKEILIQKYEEDRKRLQDGEPCYLCGSTKHPYIEHREALVFDTDEEISTQDKIRIKEEQRLTKLERAISSNTTKAESSKLEQQKIDERIQEYYNFFTSHNVTVTDESEADIEDKIDAVASHLSHLIKLRSERDKLLAQKESSHNAYILATQKRDDLKESIALLSKEITHQVDMQSRHQQNLDKSQEALKRYWHRYGLEFEETKLQEEYEALKKRKDTFEENANGLQTTKDGLAKLAVDKQGISSTIESEEKALAEIRKALDALQLQYDSLVKEKKGVLDVEDMDTYALSINTAWENAQEVLRKVSKDYALTENSHIEKQKQYDDTSRIYDEKLKQKKKEQEAFNAALRKNGFETEKAFEEASLSDEERTRLKDTRQALDKKLEEAMTLRKGSEEKLSKHEENQVPDKDIETLLREKHEQEGLWGKLNEMLGEIKNKLASDNKNRQNQEQKIKVLEKKRKGYEVIAKLSELIGASDGAKFSKFAQGITLGQLINLANKHLILLSDRYAIIRLREEGQQLELAVIDKYQGDEIRPSNTLSGGESFLVSLSLALGLSELASQKISIDSLFLDEGFGTLDSDTLDTALDALSMLESRGKMVGVISHVETLKERIPLQIAIRKNGGGESRVELVG